MTAVNLDLTRKAKKAREAWARIEAREEQKHKLDREAPSARSDWYVIGEVLAEGKAQWPSPSAFTAFLEKEGLQNIKANDRTCAMWLYKNWQTVQKAFKVSPPIIPPMLDSPQKIRQAVGVLEGWRKPALHVVKPAAQAVPLATSAPQANAEGEAIALQRPAISAPVSDDGSALALLGIYGRPNCVVLELATAEALGLSCAGGKVKFSRGKKATQEMLARLCTVLGWKAEESGNAELAALLGAAGEYIEDAGKQG